MITNPCPMNTICTLVSVYIYEICVCIVIVTLYCVSYITHKQHFSMKTDVVQGRALYNLLYHPRYEKDGDGRTKLVPVYTFPLLQAVQQPGRQQNRQQSRQQHGLQQPLKVQPSFFPEFSLFHWLQVQPLLLQSQEPGLWEHEVSEAWSSGQSVYCGW